MNGLRPNNGSNWPNKKLLFLFLFGLLPPSIQAQDIGLDERINLQVMPYAIQWESLVFAGIQIGTYYIPYVLILLVFGALFFTLKFSFINLRKFPLSIQILRGKHDHLEGKEEGEVNHFQALATAVSGTVGLGNIAMVAVAISIGGPGATFWMILAGILGMSTKFVECTLGVAYREVDGQGRIFGGPMYYLQKGFKEKGWERMGKILAGMFAILCVGASLGGGNAFQSNQAAMQMISQFGWEGEAIGTTLGLVIALFVGVVIIGGIQRIGRVTERIVPFMALMYVGAALFILASNFSLLDDAIMCIIEEAFTPRASIVGGFIGVLIQGFRRAAFSNEAGAGSAAIAHSAVKTRYPASEGLVALLEPFIDTVVVCTMTALVIILFNMEGVFTYGDVQNQQVLLETGERIGGVQITSLAFESAIPGFSYALTFAIVLFAFSTIISWSYYGLQAWKYLWGRSKTADISFKCLFLFFTVLGSAVTLDAVIRFSDAMILALVFPNMIGLLVLFPKAREELDQYVNKIKG